ncbi:MAG: AraC family transcriptional regulator [Thermodesulfobacteriota bacterium]
MTAMNRKTTKESVRYWKIPQFGGVDLLRASYVTQTFAKHSHDVYAVGVVERGALGFEYRGERLVASSGTVNLVIPGEPHTGFPATEGGWTYRMFYLDATFMAQVASKIADRTQAMPVFRAGVLHDPQLARSLAGLHLAMEPRTGALLTAGSATDAGSQPDQSRGACPVDDSEAEGLIGLSDPVAFPEALGTDVHDPSSKGGHTVDLDGTVESLFLLTLATWIARHAENPPAMPSFKAERTAVRLARKYIESHFPEPISLDELAAIAGMSPFHLLRVFRQELGLPPHAFLTQVRVRHARGLIGRGRTLAEAAVETGFVDQSHLTRHFKRILGMTPGQYRNFLQDRT